MILVDTDVISETSRAEPNPATVQWLDRHREQLYLPTLVLTELQWGLTALPLGRRRTTLEEWYGEVRKTFAARIVSYEAEAADAFVEIGSALRRQGHVQITRDSLIAAIAVARHAPVATRNVRDFAPLGVEIINPWD